MRGSRSTTGPACQPPTCQPSCACLPQAPKGTTVMVGCGWRVHVGLCPHILPRHWSFSSDGARRFAIHPGSAAANAADGWGGGGGARWVGAAQPQLRQLVHMSLGLPGKAPGEPLPHAAPTGPHPAPHPAGSLFLPAPSSLMLGRREDSGTGCGRGGSTPH